MYVLEIHEPGSADRVWARFTSSRPFLPIQPGDLLNPSAWQQPGAPAEAARVTEVEHTLSESPTGLQHKVAIFTEVAEGPRGERQAAGARRAPSARTWVVQSRTLREGRWGEWATLPERMFTLDLDDSLVDDMGPRRREDCLRAFGSGQLREDGAIEWRLLNVRSGATEAPTPARNGAPTAGSAFTSRG